MQYLLHPQYLLYDYLINLLFRYNSEITDSIISYIDISQNRQDISSNLSKINDLSDNRIIIFFEDAAEIASATTAAQLLYEAGKWVSGKFKKWRIVW